MATTATVVDTEFEAVIGLEVHSQLLTKSKMFCGCSADYAGASPNSHVCPVCLGMPGMLPVMNRTAVEYMIMTALALNCEIPEASKFDRKNYPYPDLMKGYQISQYDLPLSRHGWLMVETEDGERKIRLERVHLEEDTGKLTHVNENGESHTLLDVNRSGVPLMEIVGAPDIRSPAEARAYLVKLRTILRTIGVSSGNMEEGAFRCDANISLRPKGSTSYGTKAEVKNMNSFRSVQRALEFEIERQTKQLRSGERVVQETRGWVEDKGITVSQRSKEQAHDYRYFPEPDLPPLSVSREWVAELRSRLPELPDARRDRFISEYGLGRYDASVLTTARAMADFFEATVKEGVDPKKVSNWIQSELFRLQKAGGDTGDDSVAELGKLTPPSLAGLIKLVDAGTISSSAAKEVFEQLYRSGGKAAAIIEERGLAQISDAGALEQAVADAIANNAAAVADYKSGKTAAIGRLVGVVMKATRGAANPGLVNDLLRQKLDAA
ncbi:MAG TPA: Asp-tRNA(Asn)/Glu-tRNA(Gln) amidotransferase subunit GatB [Chloroflexota bacterium]|jgi:aspartyl-tRNA(Asn)/glutamyl-tRNA(Gln) amidotransferase subunit B|nr:Asp-tRNA(Asn)/Glu-tRNA(Gln) amidotransferase subunit GatB [Chloroflexota bacterium]